MGVHWNGALVGLQIRLPMSEFRERNIEWLPMSVSSLCFRLHKEMRTEDVAMISAGHIRGMENQGSQPGILLVAECQ